MRPFGKAPNTLHAKLPSPRLYYGWVIVIVAFAVDFSEAPTRNLLLSVFMIPVTEDLGWSRSALTGAISAGAVAGALIAPLSGHLIDRFGSKGVIVGAALISGSSLMALSFAHSFWQFTLFLVLARAFSASAMGMAVTVVIANWFIRKRGRALAITRSGTRVAIPTLILVSQFLILLYGWRVVWVMMGMMIITLAILPTVLYMRQRPEDMGLTPDGEPPVNPAQIPNPDHEEVVKPREPAWTLRAALSTQTLWFLVAATGAETMVRQAVNLHALASLIDRGVPVSAAAGVISFTVVVTGVTGLAWGFIVERLHVRYCAALAIIFKSLGIVVLVYADSIGWSILFGLLYGVGLGGSRLFSNLLFADYFGRKSLGAILGFVRPFHLVVDIAGPILASLAFDLTGSYSPALLFFLGAEAIALFAMAMAKPVPG